MQQWSSRPARLKKTLLSLFKLLLRYRCFAQGEQVGYSSLKLRKHLDVHRSTLTRALAKLEELPHLFRVLRVRRGDIAYDGIPAKRAHIEFQLGPDLCPRLAIATCVTARVSGSQASTPTTAVWVASCTAQGSTALPDHCLTTTHKAPVQNLRLKPEQPLVHEPNFSKPTSKILATGTPPHDRNPSTLRKTQPTRKAPSKTPPLPSPSHEPEFFPPDSPHRDTLFALIRQHRRLAEGKGPKVPIDAEEWTVVQEAWQSLPVGLSTQKSLSLCADVSLLALSDSRRNGRETATLRYTFAARADGQRPFLERISRLREERMARKKSEFAQQSNSLAQALFGTVTRPPKQLLRRKRRVTTNQPAPVPAAKSPALPAAEMLRNLESFKHSGYGLTG